MTTYKRLGRVERPLKPGISNYRNYREWRGMSFKITFERRSHGEVMHTSSLISSKWPAEVGLHYLWQKLMHLPYPLSKLHKLILNRTIVTWSRMASLSLQKRKKAVLVYDLIAVWYELNLSTSCTSSQGGFKLILRDTPVNSWKQTCISSQSQLGSG